VRSKKQELPRKAKAAKAEKKARKRRKGRKKRKKKKEEIKLHRTIYQKSVQRTLNDYNPTRDDEYRRHALSTTNAGFHGSADVSAGEREGGEGERGRGVREREREREREHYPEE